ncbi:hypothetical protein HRW23_22065 [Streptomyces lunaelactis]|uniref:DUF6907 domain-containing protein n=1 Tax=Streptomyces lunaelactis TaxID=1535768 RepID=UPI0015848226|nr:hypothetical protein [Streptomyces lunaelactis]NUK72126.1 hypothetical protein [Streptomyces lunaelactis]NUK80034.1 hypothetical protein [Streptomyces lunaelactis]
MSARTVTVATTDHGDITIPEPSWCIGQHPEGAAKGDISHLGKPVGLVVHTRCHGDVQLFGARIVQFPYSTSDRKPFASVEMDAGDYIDAGDHEYDDAALQRLSARLTGFALETLPQLRAALADAAEEAGR